MKKSKWGGGVSEREEAILAKFIQDYGHIQSVLETSKNENHPFRRLMQLRPDETFVRLDTIISLPSHIGNDIYERWVTGLSELRKHERIASAELDAAAMNLIFESNRRFDDNTRLLFITRSKHMHDFYQNEVKLGLWTEFGNFPLIRHPRVFSIALVVAHRSEKDDLQDLEDLSENIKFFLKNFETREFKNVGFDNNLFEQISKIKQDWKKIQQSALTLSANLPDNDTSPSTENVRAAKLILNFLKDDKKFRARITANLSELFYDVDVANDVLSLKLQFPGRLRLKEYRDNLSLPHLSSLSTPYKLYLHSEAGKNFLKKLSQKKYIRAYDVIDTFRNGFEPDGAEEKPVDEYERYLVMAYLLGLLEKWEIAESYCIRAINIGNRAKISTHEAEYFHAMCKRELRIAYSEGTYTVTWLLEVLILLDPAIVKLKTQKHNAHKLAQYWVEKGISILLFHTKNDVQNPSIPAAEEGLKLIEDWEEKIVDNLPLQLVALRTKMDYFVAREQFEYLSHLHDKYILLREKIMGIEKDNSKLPPYIVDNIIWIKWVLFPRDFAETDQREILIKQLENARDREINQKIRNEIDYHIEKIEQGKSYIDSG